MSQTLGEKLRQAREDKGLTLAEVAEQTRISSLYLDSIEKDDYKILPGGIFNKGFVKSYAKFVGVSEQEAVGAYMEQLAATEMIEIEETKLYRPEVLTDDRSGPSNAPTIIFAVVILAAFTAGILFLVNYLRSESEPTVATNASQPNVSSTPIPGLTQAPPTDAPEMSAITVEFKAISAPVSLSATTDGKLSSNTVAPGTAATFSPKETLKLSYSRSLANAVQLAINGKQITLPAQPLNGRRNAIEFEINRENLARIWADGAIAPDAPAAAVDTSAAPTNTVAPPVRPVGTPAPRPTPASNTSPRTTPRPQSSPRPAATPARTPEL